MKTASSSAPDIPDRRDERPSGTAAPQPKRAYSAPTPIFEEEAESFVQRFVPDMVVERLFHGGAIQSQELSRYEQAVVGFFDVSGFSALARDLEQSDKTRSEKALKKRSASSFMAQHSVSGKGAEELVRQLNQTLSVLIDTIRTAGGDIIKFAGDAILVVWLCEGEHTMERQLLRASECALACCALKSDQSKLGLHVGVGCGELVAAHVGGTFGRWEFFIAGDACTQSALAEHHAGINQVVLSPQAITLTKQSKIVVSMESSEVEEGYCLLSKIQLQSLGPASKPHFSLSTDANVAKAAEGYVPGPVRDALKSGGSTSASVGGLRKLTVIFFKLYDVNLPSAFDSETEKQFLAQCQTQAKLVQDSAYHYYATLRQFILDDKGFVAIVALGLPPFYHEDNAVRAVKVAKRLIEHHKIKASAGICTGTVFCGVVGSPKRAEYSVAGSCINLAARLMAKAPIGSIWCDATTKSEAESLGQIRFEQMPSLPFKGFDQPVEIYGPMMNFVDTPPPKGAGLGGSKEALGANGKSDVIGGGSQSNSGKVSSPTNVAGKTDRDDLAAQKKKKTGLVRADSKRSSVALVGMDQEQAAVARAGFVGNSLNPVRVCFVEGDAGSGKTRLAEWVLKETSARRSILTSADSSETNTPFFVWRTILQSILSLTSRAATGPAQNGSFIVAPRPGSALGEIKEGKTLAAAPSRKRGLSNDDALGMGPSAPPQPTHRRNLSSESNTSASGAVPALPSHLRMATTVGVQSHRRSPSNTSATEAPSPLRKELTQRATREDSMLGDAAATTEEATGTSDEGEMEDEEDKDKPSPLLYAAPPPASTVAAAPVPSGGGRFAADSVTSSTSPHSRTNNNNNNGNYVPERSLVLEALHESGKLRGRRLSSLHAILPNLVIPPELDTHAPSGSNESAMQRDVLSSGEASRPLSNLTALLASKLVTPQRKASLSGKTFFGGSINTGAAAPSISASTSGESKAGEPMSEAMASMELMGLLVEECGLLGTLLIVIENAQYMDKQSWELLKRLCEMQPPSWKGEHRVRFVVTYRPFTAPREHPLQMLLHGPLTATSSLPNVVPSSTTTTTTSAGANVNVVVSAASPPLGASSAATALNTSIPSESQQSSASGTIKAATERVSSTLSALAHHATHRRRSVEGTIVTSNIRTSGSEVRSDFHPTEGAESAERTEPQVVRVVINPLSLREAGVFLSNVHRIAIGPKLLQFIYKKARGNPRAVLDLFKALQDQDLITVDQTTGMVEETTSLDDICDIVFVIPLHLRAQLQQQFDKLLNREQLILKLASVVGSVFPVPLLRWLYKQRATTPVSPGGSLTTMTTTTMSSAVESPSQQIVSEEASQEADFQAGLKELREKGFVRPLFSRFPAEMDRTSTGAADVVRGKTRSSVEEDEDEDASSSSSHQDNWMFDSDFTRLIVYSQMLHTARREIHGLVVDWYASRPKQVRLHEDPANLGNHAIGAERPKLAFQAFREGLRRVVFREEAVGRGERYWQSCVDLLEDSSTGFTLSAVQAYRVVVDVLMGHVCVQNDAWDEAKHYLNRALELYDKLLTSFVLNNGSLREGLARRTSSAALISLGGGGCLSLRRQLKCVAGPARGTASSGSSSNDFPSFESNKREGLFLRDPLAVDAQADPVGEAKAYAALARALLKRIEDLQQSHKRMVLALKEFSIKQTASKD